MMNSIDYDIVKSQANILSEMNDNVKHIREKLEKKAN